MAGKSGFYCFRLQVLVITQTGLEDRDGSAQGLYHNSERILGL